MVKAYGNLEECSRTKRLLGYLRWVSIYVLGVWVMKQFLDLDRVKVLFPLALVASALFIVESIFCPGSLAAKNRAITVAKLKGQSGADYVLFEKNDLKVGWHIQRPSKTDDRVHLCIPAAFTTKSGTVVGIYAVRGKVGNRKAISKSIGGALLIEDGKFRILPTGGGALFSQSFVGAVEKNKSSLFQQFQIVVSGKAAKFKDKKLYQMRALVQFKDGRSGVIESKGDLSFKDFNLDLVGLGVENALYTDMGAWDEGWYRNQESKEGKIVTIGNDRSKTDKQTNWLVFYDHEL